MPKNAALYALIALLSAGLIYFAIDRDKDIEIEGGKGTTPLKISIKSGKLDHQQLLEKMFADDFFKTAAKDWFVKNQMLSSIDDPHLASQLEKNACPDIPSEAGIERERALKSCAEKPANQLLRQLAFEKRGYPFHLYGERVQMSVPEKTKDRPNKGGGSVCGSSNMAHRETKIFNFNNNKSILIRPTGIIPCQLINMPAMLHLSPEDAREILGLSETTEARGTHTVYIVH